MRRLDRTRLIAAGLCLLSYICLASPADARAPFLPRPQRSQAAASEQPACPTPEQIRDAIVPGSYDKPVTVPHLANGAQPFEAIAGKSWNLAAFGGERLEAGTRAPTITLERERVTGFGGCNHYTGEAKATADGGLVLGAIAATRMACEPAAMELESRYLTALQAVTRYRIGDDRLVLSASDGDRVKELVFVKSAEPRD